MKKHQIKQNPLIDKKKRFFSGEIFSPCLPGMRCVITPLYLQPAKISDHNETKLSQLMDRLGVNSF